jgi:DNA polymerase (family 10)
MHKREIAHVIRSMGALLEIKGEESFKVRAYENAADSIERGDFDLEAMAREGRLTEIPWIGKNLEPKLRELVLTGRSSFLERLVQEVPEGLLDLLRVPGIGPKTARLLHESLGVTGLDGLKKALQEHRVRDLPGLGARREELMQKGLCEIEKYVGRVSLGLALPVLEGLQEAFGLHGARSEIVGETRRYEETVSSLDVLVMEEPGEPPAETLRRAAVFPSTTGPDIAGAWDEEARAFVFRTSFGIPLRLYFADRGSFWPRAIRLTGPSSFVLRLQDKARSAGYRFSEWGLLKDGRPVEVREEGEVYDLLGASPIPPELRHREVFVEAALSGAEDAWPDLVATSDLKGDLHVHTTWSDGVSGIEEMVQKAITLGYSYIAITDHATDIRLIRGLTLEKMEAQLLEIGDLKRKYPGIRILTGVEVDILKDGRLYFPDEMLSRLDAVIASVHQDIGDARGELESRLMKAARNPLVDVIGHPTGRLIGRRPGHLTGWDAVFEAAAESGTALEINSSPERLDLPEDLAAPALSAGAAFAICTDAHSVEGLENIRYGVIASARRAGVPKRRVVNAAENPLSLLKD